MRTYIMKTYINYIAAKAWLWTNKTPSTPILAYLNIVLPWTTIGMLLLAGAAAISPPTNLGVLMAITLLIILITFTSVRADIRNQYVAAIHANQVRRWNKLTTYALLLVDAHETTDD